MKNKENCCGRKLQRTQNKVRRLFWSVELMSSPVAFPGKQTLRPSGRMFIKEYPKVETCDGRDKKQDGAEGESELQSRLDNRLSQPPEAVELAWSFRIIGPTWLNIHKPA